MIHLARDGNQLGQFTIEQVNDMLAAGQLKISDLAWREGLSGWVPLAGLEGVTLLAASAAGPASATVDQPAPVAAPASVYAPPQGNISPPAGYAGHVSPGTVLALRQTRPWVLFLAIIGIIFTGLMLLGGVSVMAFGALGAAKASPGIGGMEAGFIAGMGVFYLVFAVLYLYPIIKLFKYAGAIRRLAQSSSVGELEEALRQQKSFWKFIGILTIVIMVVYLFVIVALGAGALSSFFSMSRSTPPPSPTAAP